MSNLSQSSLLRPGYRVRLGSTLDRALLVKFMQRTYQELCPGEAIAHLASTVDQYLSRDTPIWWVEPIAAESIPSQFPEGPSDAKTAGVLWAGSAIDQTSGDRHAHILLLYVAPSHRRRGLGSALMAVAEDWARARGDRAIGLQVFQSNQPALRLYETLGYAPQSIWMSKRLEEGTGDR
ncbi:MAG TPA: GNAT family N-acetyltransferase [Chroococcidiopsis sp.]